MTNIATQNEEHQMNRTADLAAAMYPDMNDPPAEPAAGAAEVTVSALAQDVAHMPDASSSFAERIYGEPRQEEARPDLSIDELVAEPSSAADLMYPDGGHALESPEDYDQQALRERFESLQAQARHDRNEEDDALLAEGRQQAAIVLHEMAVPSEAARDIAVELETWNGRWIRDDLPELDEMDATRKKTEDALRKEWGPKYNANVKLAQQAYQDAAKRLPWLRNLVEDAGAGNSATLLRQFAKIGLKQARNRRVSGKNR